MLSLELDCVYVKINLDIQYIDGQKLQLEIEGQTIIQ